MPVLRIPVLGGVDERPAAPANSAKSILNMRFDSDQGRWVHDRGYTAYTPLNPTRGAAIGYAMHLFETRGGATRDVLVEREDGTGGLGIYTLRPHLSSGLSTYVTGRHRPTSSEPATCFATFGNFVVACNGYDRAIKLFPLTGTNARVEQFSWDAAPSAPAVLPCGGGTIVASPVRPLWAFTDDGTDVTVGYLKDNVLGLGDPIGGATSTYLYKYSWVNDSGSESPLSAPSNSVTWVSGVLAVPPATGEDARYGLTVTGIQRGPEGTVRRRLYRTRNLGETQQVSDATYYFVCDINDNYTTEWTDSMPDGLMGSEAPTNLQASTLPPNIRWAVPHAGRMWVVVDDYTVRWSQSGAPEQFGIADLIDVSGRNGGRITGLAPYNDMLIVMRENAIDLIYAVGSTGYRAIPVIDSVGSRAPHAAITAPGYGLLLLCNDGVYSVSGTYTGGAAINVARISDGLTDFWTTVNIQAAAKAWAWYNARDREVVFAMPTGSATYPTVHLVLSLDGGNAANPAWSFRENIQSAAGVLGPEGFPYMLDSGQNPLKTVICTSVWNGQLFYGYTSGVLDPAPEGKWESTDLDLGDPDQSKVVRTVTATMSLCGNSIVTLDAYLDADYELGGSNTSDTQPQDKRVATVLGTVVQGTDTWSYRGLTEVRFDLAAFHCRRFRFALRCSQVFGIHNVSIHYENQGLDKPFAAPFRVPPFNTTGNPNMPPGKVPSGRP